MKMFHRILRIAAFCVALLPNFSGCATLDEQESRWIFRPTHEAWRGGEAVLTGMQDVWIPFDSKVTQQAVKLHGLWLPQMRNDAPVLLFLHGARWDLHGSAHRMRRMHELGFAVLGVDYRGFGRSGDELPSEPKAYEDAHQAWAWLAAAHPQAKRYIFGHSLGGAIAIELAASVPDEAGLIVEGTFTSVADVVSSHRWGFLPLNHFITQRFESAQRIAQVGSPVLVVHGEADAVIPINLGQRLFDAAVAPKRLERVPGGTHHNTNELGQTQYRAAVQALFGLPALPETLAARPQ